MRDGHAARVHRSVVVLGPARLTPHERLWAAYLAAGPGALASFCSARALLGVRDWTGAPHVTSPTQRRPLRGAFLHVGTIPAAQVAHRGGMRLTGPARTLADCALLCSQAELVDDVEAAVGKGLVTFAGLERGLARLRGHHGVGRLAAALGVIADDPGAGRTRSELEALFRRRLRTLTGLPPYVRNQPLALPDGTVVVPDVLFPVECVWLELDSRRWHEQRRAMDADRRRDQRAAALGFLPFRITWRHLVREWREVSADLLEVLARRRGLAA